MIHLLFVVFELLKFLSNMSVFFSMPDIVMKSVSLRVLDALNKEACSDVRP